MSSIFTNRGQAAKESLNQKKSNIDFKKVFIKLKDGESIRVRVLTAEDYVEYMAHGSYNHGIYTQPCIKTMGDKCALCEASNLRLEDFDGLYAKKRYLFALADLDAGEVRIFDATKGQAQGIIDAIEQYAEDLADVAFTFKRTGTKTDTNYSLNPILKLKADDKEKFAGFDGMVVENEFFNTVLQPRTREQMIEDLGKAGFPVAEIGGSAPAPAPAKGTDETKKIEGSEGEDSLF